MIVTIVIEGADIHINDIGLPDLLLRVSIKGKEYGLEEQPATK